MFQNMYMYGAALLYHSVPLPGHGLTLVGRVAVDGLLLQARSWLEWEKSPRRKAFEPVSWESLESLESLGPRPALFQPGLRLSSRGCPTMRVYALA